MLTVSRHQVVIARPQAEVFRALVALERLPRWFPEVEALDARDPQPCGALGERYRGRTRALRRVRSFELRVAAHEPDAKLALEASLDPTRPRFDFDLRDLGGGETALALSCRTRADGAAARAALPLLRRVLERRVPRALGNLKRQLETGRETMRASLARAFGPAAEVQALASAHPAPSLGAHDVLVRVVASSVNPIDCLRRGGYGRRLFGLRGAASLPLLLGRDLSGVVEAVGGAVRRFRPGDAVWAATDPMRPGTWAELAAVHEAELAPKPVALSHEEAAALPYAGLTAWTALVDRAGLGPETAAGRRVLVHAGVGGVGSVALQLLRAWGAEVTTTCSGANATLARELGAERVIDYEREDYGEALGGLDAALDTLGGEHEARTLATLRERAGAQYVTVVHPLVAWSDRFGIPAGPLLAGAEYARRRLRERVLHGRGYHWALFRPNGEALRVLGELVEAGRLRPVIDSVHPLEAMVEAHARVESRHARGKVVIRIAGDA